MHRSPSGRKNRFAGGTSTAPTYRGLAEKGLIRKDYLNGDTGTGGVYLWESRDLTTTPPLPFILKNASKC